MKVLTGTGVGNFAYWIEKLRDHYLLRDKYQLRDGDVVRIEVETGEEGESFAQGRKEETKARRG